MKTRHFLFFARVVCYSPPLFPQTMGTVSPFSWWRPPFFPMFRHPIFVKFALFCLSYEAEFLFLTGILLSGYLFPDPTMWTPGTSFFCVFYPDHFPNNSCCSWPLIDFFRILSVFFRSQFPLKFTLAAIHFPVFFSLPGLCPRCALWFVSPHPNHTFF